MDVAKEALAKKLLKPERAGTPWLTTITQLEAITIRVATGSWDERRPGPDWPSRQGLYVSNTVFQASPREFIRVVYVMGCGTIIQTILRKSKFDDYKKKYNPSRGETDQGAEIDGFLVPFDEWVTTCKLDDFAVKEGDKKSFHYASKPS